MASMMMISGCLGTGKTTLSKALARLTPAGLHQGACRHSLARLDTVLYGENNIVTSASELTI
jgi:hypothetical protein